MSYVSVLNDHPLRELEIGISIATTEETGKADVLARAVVDTGATTCCIDEDYVLEELSATPIDFVPTQVPGQRSPQVCGYFDLTVSVPERTESDFALPAGLRPGTIQRIVYAIGMQGIPSPRGSGTRFFLLGMDFLSSLSFAFHKERSRSVFWMASPQDGEDRDLRRHFLPK